jgi:hypothetical protein
MGHMNILAGFVKTYSCQEVKVFNQGMNLQKENIRLLEDWVDSLYTLTIG